MAGAASILGDQRIGWPGSVPCSQDHRQSPHPLCTIQRSCANDSQPPLDLKGGPPPSPSVGLGLAGMSPCARPSSQRSPGSGQAQGGGGVPLTQVARWGASRIRNTWLGQPRVPVSLHPALGQLTHRAEPGREPKGRDPPGLPTSTHLSTLDIPCGLNPSITQLGGCASSALRLLPVHLASLTKGGSSKLEAPR